jgi:purine-binding chemotaxis protein CheW
MNLEEELGGLGASSIDGVQYLVFGTAGENFAVPISKIKEIIEYVSITRVPQMSEFMLGVTNIRGSVVSVIDLARRLGIGVINESSKTCIVIEEFDKEENQVFEVGFLVDSIDQVHTIGEEASRGHPNFGTMTPKRFIEQMVKVGESFVVALNLSQVLDIEELSKNIYSRIQANKG